MYKVLTSHEHIPEFYVLYVTVWLLYIYRTPLRTISYEMDILCHISTRFECTLH